MEGILPTQVLWRKKSPYPKTHDPSYEMLVRNRMETLLERKNAPLFELVSAKAVRRMLDEDLQWPWYGQLMRRPQTICYLLQINTWLEHYNIDIAF